ncbi:MAG TPA: dipeptidase PepE [Phnomibacter sp.]|nr:dipeptidase PepE [Phnomibacter sp.]
MQLLIASTSTVYGSSYLGYLEQPAKQHFSGCKKILFVPFARAGGLSWHDYTAKAAAVFITWGFQMKGAHEYKSPAEALSWADGIFTGGGNTFLLLKTIYEGGWFDALQKEVLNGKPYMGTSAGSNICGISIGSTNDMPIVQPPSLQAMGWISFNLNPHYLDPLLDSTHMGETREERIKEFHYFNEQPVLGLREGSYLLVNGDRITLEGPHTARLFRAKQEPVEIGNGPLNL